MGPANLRLYIIKEEMPPMVMPAMARPPICTPPDMYKSPPNTLMSDRDRLLTKLTEGPVMLE